MLIWYQESLQNVGFLLPEVINQDPIIQNIHTNNQKIIEIYIKNQVRKIIKFLEDKTKRQDEPKKIINSKKWYS